MQRCNHSTALKPEGAQTLKEDSSEEVNTSSDFWDWLSGIDATGAVSGDEWAVRFSDERASCWICAFSWWTRFFRARLFSAATDLFFERTHLPVWGSHLRTCPLTALVPFALPLPEPLFPLPLETLPF